MFMIGLVCFFDISTLICYLKRNPLPTNILIIYDLVWFHGISTIVGLSNAKSSLYLYIKYI